VFLFEVKSWSNSKYVSAERPSVNTGFFHGFYQTVPLSHVLASESLHEAGSAWVLHHFGELFREILETFEEISSSSFCVFRKFVFLDQLILGDSQMDAHGVTKVGVVMSHWRCHLGFGGVVEAAGVHLLGEAHEVRW